MWRMRWGFVPHRTLSADFSLALASQLPSNFPRDLLPFLHSFQCTALQVKHYTVISSSQGKYKSGEIFWYLQAGCFVSVPHTVGFRPKDVCKTHSWSVSSEDPRVRRKSWGYSIDLNHLVSRPDPHNIFNAWYFKRRRTA
jgi:hypothetical protein